MDIDAHLHLWTYWSDRFSWIDPGSVLAADHGPDDARAAAAPHGIGRFILVEAEGSAEETRWLLDIAEARADIAGIVGWVDLRAPDVAETIRRLARAPKLVGLRHQVQNEADDYLSRPDVVRGVRACVAAGLSFDILVFARQAGRVPAFLETVGEGRFVLDHGAKPPIADGGWQPWADDMRRIAAFPGTWCKLSGLVTEADHADWRADRIRPYMNHLLDCFGPERLIFGSDWPVCRLAAGYGQVHGLAAGFVAERCPAFRDAVFGGNARRAYALEG